MGCPSPPPSPPCAALVRKTVSPCGVKKQSPKISSMFNAPAAPEVPAEERNIGGATEEGSPDDDILISIGWGLEGLKEELGSWVLLRLLYLYDLLLEYKFIQTITKPYGLNMSYKV